MNDLLHDTIDTFKRTLKEECNKLASKQDYFDQILKGSAKIGCRERIQYLFDPIYSYSPREWVIRDAKKFAADKGHSDIVLLIDSCNKK